MGTTSQMFQRQVSPFFDSGTNIQPYISLLFSPHRNAGAIKESNGVIRDLYKRVKLKAEWKDGYRQIFPTVQLSVNTLQLKKGAYSSSASCCNPC
jgi:hypothetical protein